MGVMPTRKRAASLLRRLIDGVEQFDDFLPANA
jgi:hypothetical protein